jgi:hypothetical protein
MEVIKSGSGIKINFYRLVETTPATDILLQSGWGADTSNSSSWIYLYKPPKTKATHQS